MRELNYFPDFVSLMAQAETLGVHGKKYHFPRLGHVIELMAEEGLIYNSNTYSFIEDSRKSISKNWGVLREGQLAHFTILKLDLVKNTEMVRQNDAEIVNKIFSIIKQDIIEIVQSRLGRVCPGKEMGVFVLFILVPATNRLYTVLWKSCIGFFFSIISLIDLTDPFSSVRQL
jgi:hypothetical protein